MWSVKALHILSISFFIGFVMIDTFVIRRFLNGSCYSKKKEFYESARFSLVLVSFVIFLSGGWLAFGMGFALPDAIVLKIFLAFLAISLFFAAPTIVERFFRKSVDFIYAAVLLLSVAVVFLSQL